MANLVIQIGAGPENKGEIEYLQATARDIQQQGANPNTVYFSYRNTDVGEGDLDNVNALTVEDAAYEALPNNANGSGVYDALSTAIEEADAVQIVGYGNSTLDEVLEVQAMARAVNPNADVAAAYVTHKVNGSGDAVKIINDDVRVFTQETKAELEARMPETQGSWDDLHTQMMSLPTLASSDQKSALEISEGAYADTLEHSPNSEKIARMMAAGKPMVLAVLNAGFEADEKASAEDELPPYLPYNAEEAFFHGQHLGKNSPEGATLLLAQGGPRNLRDELGEDAKPFLKGNETHTTQLTSDAFRQGYLDGQREQYGESAKPEVIEERFVKGSGYNVVKALPYMAAQAEGAKLVPSSESYWLLNMAIESLPGKKLGGAYAHDAMLNAHSDPEQSSRISAIRRFNAGGIPFTMIDADGQVTELAAQKSTPYKLENGSKVVINALDLAQRAETAAPAPRAAASRKFG